MKKKVGEIDVKTATELKRQAGDIVLEQGDQNFGQIHIELRHGDQIRQAGYENVETFVEKVAQDYEQIRKGRQPTLILACETENEATHEAIFVKLTQDDEYSVQTGGIFRKDYIEHEKRKLLWERSNPSDKP